MNSDESCTSPTDPENREDTSPKSILRIVLFSIGMLSIAAVCYSVLYRGSPSTHPAFTLAVLAWNAAPPALVVLLVYQIKLDEWACRTFLLAITVLVAVGGILPLMDYSSAQSAIAFLTLPVVEFFMIALFASITYALVWIGGWKRSKEED